jgi:hypothetical protein
MGKRHSDSLVVRLAGRFSDHAKAAAAARRTADLRYLRQPSLARVSADGRRVRRQRRDSGVRAEPFAIDIPCDSYGGFRRASTASRIATQSDARHQLKS